MKIILIGSGSTGAYIYSLLEDSVTDLTFIDDNLQAIQELPEAAQDKVIHDDPTNPVVLRQAGVEEADALAAITDQDDINLVVATLAKFEYGLPRVIARVNQPDHEWLFNPSMGVDVAVNEAEVIGRLLIEEMQTRDSHIVAKFKQGGYKLIEFTVQAGSFFDQKTLEELDLPKDSLIILVENQGDYLVPNGQHKLLAGNQVMALISEVSYPKFQEIIKEN